MNLAELIAECKAITRRPDLHDRTQSAVLAATLKVHHMDFWYKDLVEVTIEFDDPQFISNFAPTDVIPRYRKAKYIRIWEGDATSGVPLSFLTPIQIEQALDGYGYHKNNVFYQAGNLIQIRTAQPLKRALFGCYVHPNVTTSAYSSWIAVEEPYAIVHEACRVIFREIGATEQANTQERLLAEILTSMRMSYIDDIPVT